MRVRRAKIGCGRTYWAKTSRENQLTVNLSARLHLCRGACFYAEPSWANGNVCGREFWSDSLSSQPFGLNPSHARAPRSVFCNGPDKSARALVTNGYSAPRPPLAQPVLPQTAASSTIIHRLICHITPAWIHSVSCHMDEIGINFVLELHRPSDLYIIYVFIIFCISVFPI